MVILVVVRRGHFANVATVHVHTMPPSSCYCPPSPALTGQWVPGWKELGGGGVDFFVLILIFPFVVDLFFLCLFASFFFIKLILNLLNLNKGNFQSIYYLIFVLFVLETCNLEPLNVFD